MPVPLAKSSGSWLQPCSITSSGTGMNELAEETPCLVLYPAQSTSANPQRCWNW
ncbi:MAG: esterase, partial [Lysobacteraceae bacterium]